MFNLDDVTNLGKSVLGDDASYPLKDILTDEFIKNNSTLSGIQDLLSKVGVNNLEDLTSKLGSLNTLIQNNSNFDSWKSFIAKAGKDYLSQKLLNK